MATIPNLPNVRPSLLLDFQRSRRVDPRLAGFRATPAGYFGPDGRWRTAGVNTPRIDFDPLTGECRGCLIEGEARTNQLWYSTTFGVGGLGWYTGANTTLAVGGGAPDGGATVIIQNTVAGNAFQGTSYSATAGQSITQSVWWRGTSKPSVGSVIAIDYFDGPQTYQRAMLNFNDPKVIADGRWRRYSLTVTTQKTAAGVGAYFCVDTGPFNGEMWGPQVEVGKTASSYIATTGASGVTRAAESVSLSVAPYLNQSEGAILEDFSLEVVAANEAFIFHLRDPSGVQSRLQLRETTLIAGADLFAVAGSTPVLDTASRALTVGKNHRSASRYKSGDSGFSLDGQAVLTAAGASFPFATPFSLLVLGENMMGHIQRVALYTQGLPNNQLQALTT